MNTKSRYALIFALVLFGGVVLVAITQAAPGAITLAGGSPSVVSYQGQVTVSGTPYTGNGYFKFAVVNTAGNTSYWSNDNTSTSGEEPTAAVQLSVSSGLFSILLGDTTLSGMTQALTADVFGQPDRYLRVWFSIDGSTYDQLMPDTRIAAVPYALQAQEAVDADTVDGLHANQLMTHYQNVVVVAKSGGDYISVQAAIDNATGATAVNPYLVWVAPGVYTETVIMKPYVHLQGAGQDATVINSTVSYSGDWPPTLATLVLASDTSLRDLTVGNSGAGDSNTAVLATTGMTRTLLADVTAQALGGGTSNFAILLTGSGTGATLQQVTALAENGSGTNIGLLNFNHAAAVLYDGNYTAREGTNARGIFLITSTLEAHNVTALGENGSNLNTGLGNYDNSTAVLYGGEFTGRGGNQTGGAGASHNSTLTAYGITALAENGNGAVGNYALGCYDSSTATLHGGVFIARGGVNNYALSNEFNVTMKAVNITALAENGSNNNHGLWNVNNAKLVLHGASLTGLGGTNAYGIYSANDGTTLEAESVTALGKDGSDGNYGLYNSGQYSSDIVTTTLRNSSFTGASGAYAYGIYISSTLTTLAAESVAALGENSSTENYGLFVTNGADVTVRGGYFTGLGGVDAIGIGNFGDNTMLDVASVTALGEGGSNFSFGLINGNSVPITNATANVTQSVLEGMTNSVILDSGTVTASNSRLAGNSVSVVSGTMTCVAVSRNAIFNANGCP